MSGSPIFSLRIEALETKIDNHIEIRAIKKATLEAKFGS